MRVRKTAADRQAEIARAALSLAFDVGPSQVSTGMIADRLGLTQPAIYKHFPRKQDIWLAVTDQLSARIAQNIARAATAPIAPDMRLRMLIMDHLEVVRENPALPDIMVMRDAGEAQGELRSRMQANMGKLRIALIENVRSALAQGIFRDTVDPADAATLLLGIIQSLVLRMLMARDPQILLQDGERLLNLQLAGFSRLEKE
jgi:AcrR family transcriptional regulator